MFPDHVFSSRSRYSRNASYVWNGLFSARPREFTCKDRVARVCSPKRAENLPINIGGSGIHYFLHLVPTLRRLRNGLKAHSIVSKHPRKSNMELRCASKIEMSAP
jgi:hypothetical protein